jgi:hypothetical protein
VYEKELECSVQKSCSNKIYGLINDGQTGMPIDRANITAKCDDQELEWTLTGHDGTYTLGAAPTGSCELTFQAGGYIKITGSVEMKNANEETATITENLSLQPIRQEENTKSSRTTCTSLVCTAMPKMALPDQL